MPLSPPSSSVQPSSYQTMMEGLGVFAQTADRDAGTSRTQLTSGTARYNNIGLRAGDLVTSMVVCVAVVGAGLTLSKVGLYSKTGAQLAVSADQGTSWENLGYRVAPMVTPYRVSVSDVYFAAILGVGGTQPQMPRGVSNTPTVAAQGSFPASAYDQSGLTDLPSPAVYAAGSAVFWVGVL